MQLAEKKGEYNCIDCTSIHVMELHLFRCTLNYVTIKLLHKCKIGRVARSVQVQIKRTMKRKAILRTLERDTNTSTNTNTRSRKG